MKRCIALAATWLAFAECQQGSATGDAGVEVVAPGARIEIRGGGPVRVVPPRPRHWTFADPPADLDLFDGVLTREGGDLKRAIARVITLAKATPKDPFGALRAWLGAGGPSAPKPAAE